MRRFLALLVALPMTVWLSGCDDTPTGPDATSPEALYGSWTLVSLQEAGGPTVAKPGAAEFTAEFTADGSLRARADCNNCNGTYEAGAGTLTVSPMGCTRAFCQTAPVDTQFTTLLGAATQWRVEGSSLELGSESGTLLLER